MLAALFHVDSKEKRQRLHDLDFFFATEPFPYDCYIIARIKRHSLCPFVYDPFCANVQGGGIRRSFQQLDLILQVLSAQLSYH